MQNESIMKSADAWFLAIEIEFQPSKAALAASQVNSIIQRALNTAFGHASLCMPVDVISVARRRALLRCRTKDVVGIVSALALLSEYDEALIAVRSVASSAALMHVMAHVASV